MHARPYSVLFKKKPSFVTGILNSKASWSHDELTEEATFMNFLGRRIEAIELLMQLFRQEASWSAKDRELLFRVVDEVMENSI